MLERFCGEEKGCYPGRGACVVDLVDAFYPLDLFDLQLADLFCKSLEALKG